MVYFIIFVCLEKKKPTDAVKDTDTHTEDDDKDDETQHKVDDMDKKDQLGLLKEIISAVFFFLSSMM